MLERNKSAVNESKNTVTTRRHAGSKTMHARTHTHMRTYTYTHTHMRTQKRVQTSISG